MHDRMRYRQTIELRSKTVQFRMVTILSNILLLDIAEGHDIKNQKLVWVTPLKMEHFETHIYDSLFKIHH